MAKKTLQACRNAEDFIGFAKKNGGKVVTSKNGVKIYGPNGNQGYASLHSNHPRELATGTRSALIKAFVAIGLGILTPVACLIVALMYS